MKVFFYFLFTMHKTNVHFLKIILTKIRNLHKSQKPGNINKIYTLEITFKF